MKDNAYTSLPLEEKLKNKILTYYQTLWQEKRFTTASHKLWLSNFKEPEKLTSLYLLSKFMFFGNDEIREMLISIFRDKFKYSIVEKFRRTNNDTTDLDAIKKHFEAELALTRFVSLGKASESGAHILFLFRQSNKLGTRSMKSSSEIIYDGALVEPEVKRYIFIDDFCGSGETAVKYNTLVDAIKSLNPEAQLSYFVLFSTEEGFSYVERFASFDNVDATFILDSSYKCFSDGSRYFTEVYSGIDKEFARKFATEYGIPLVANTPIKGHPLGFDNGQLLIGFAHNTPDNTLPIFWGAENWNPIFVRFIKTT